MQHTIRLKSSLFKVLSATDFKSPLKYYVIPIMNRQPSGYYYEGESSSYSGYPRPPWSSNQADSMSGGGGVMFPVPSRALASTSNNPTSFYQYQWTSASQASVRPTTSQSSRYSHSHTSRVGSSHLELGGDDIDMDLENWTHIDDGIGGVPRNWEHTGVGMMLSSNASTTFNEAFRFTLMSYNILAASLLEKNAEIYRHCDPSALDWGTRLTGIFEEINRFRPDIVCLQEVEATQYALAFECRLNDLGYRGVFKKKTGDKDDGCAIFYRISKFLLLGKLEVEFMQPHIPLLNRDNVALLVKLETRDVAKRQKIVVGTTHLLFNPRRHDVRLAQTQVLLAELDRFAFSGFDRNRRPMYHPVLMTGDFNCQSHSSVTRLINDGQLQYLDENGDMIKWVKRRVSDSLLPSQCGITDHCQHYKLVLERYKRWTLMRSNNFELEIKVQEPLVDIFPYLNFRDEPDQSDSDSALRKGIVSLYMPDVERTDSSTWSTTETVGDEDYLRKAAKRLAVATTNNADHKGGSANTVKYHEHLNRNVLDEMGKLGLACNFGSGRLSHSFHFRDVYGGKLDRKVNGPGVTTVQSGWSCVDYIFQSMTWNDSFNKVVEGKLKLVRRYGLPSRIQCKQLGDIPSKEHPSDHFPLVAEFLLR